MTEMTSTGIGLEGVKLLEIAGNGGGAMPSVPHLGVIRSLHAYSALAAGLTLSAMLLADLSGRANETAVPQGTPEPGIIVFDTVGSAMDEGRAEYGDVFIGTVLSVAGKEELPSSDPDFSTMLIFYDVAVEETLNGSASGQVRVRIYGADLESPDFPDAQKLEVGERYMFFGGFISDGEYYSIAAGRGVILIRDDAQAAQLEATYEPLIRAAEREVAAQARQAQAVDPCEHPTAPPAITVEPSRGAVGDAVRLTGGPFIRPEAPVWWDGRRVLLAAAPIATDCTTDTVVTIPPAEPGAYRISIQDAGGNEAKARFEVIRE
jgi:hypothetical protein